MARALTPGLAAAVVESGQIMTRIDVLDWTGQELLMTTSTTIDAPRMQVVGGSIATSETTAVPGKGTFDLLVDEDTAGHVIPRLSRHSLSPTAEAFVQISFHAVGDPESTAYGRYDVANMEIEETNRGIVMSGEIFDNARRVERAQFFRPRTIANKTFYADAFTDLLESVLPESEIQVVETKARTGLLTWDIQDDRLAAVNEMATAITYRIDWNNDGIGNTLIGPENNVSDDPVWSFIDGGNAKVLSMKRALTDERSYNGVIAMGESTGSGRAPVRAEAWDLDPNSPTYFNPTKPDESSYGPHPFFYVSAFIKTLQQARDAAKARLPKVLDLVEVLSLTAFRHPGITPGDPILVQRPRIAAEGVFVVESVDLPLTGRAGNMNVVCRDRRVIPDE